MRQILAFLAITLLPGFAQASVVVTSEISHPLVRSGTAQTAYLKIAVRGKPAPKDEARAPVNVAIVLDKSGSMGGQKIAEARRAATLAVERLHPDDIVSVVTYDSVVHVVVPATKAVDKQSIKAAINGIHSSGQTALFAGVAKGAAELRKFLDPERVNRVILLSDGMANVGPSSPGELAALGASLSKEGIAVTTIGLGLGYNEDLMARLAQSSEGNHAFAEGAEDLARIFNLEFGDLFAVTAQDIQLEISCAPGVRPIRVLGREALVSGQKITARLGHLAGVQERFLLVEVELPRLPSKGAHPVASTSVSYRAKGGSHGKASGKVHVRTSSDPKAIESAVTKPVMVSVTEMLVAEQNKVAIRLRDEGRKKEAKKVMQRNVEMLQKRAKKYKSKRLRQQAPKAKRTLIDFESVDWNRTRKRLRKSTYGSTNQQSY